MQIRLKFLHKVANRQTDRQTTTKKTSSLAEVTKDLYCEFKIFCVTQNKA